MKHRIITGLAASVFVLGMVCDEGTAGTISDDGCNVYCCDGRNWIRTGSI